MSVKIKVLKFLKVSRKEAGNGQFKKSSQSIKFSDLNLECLIFFRLDWKTRNSNFQILFPILNILKHVHICLISGQNSSGQYTRSFRQRPHYSRRIIHGQSGLYISGYLVAGNAFDLSEHFRFNLLLHLIVSVEGGQGLAEEQRRLRGYQLACFNRSVSYCQNKVIFQWLQPMVYLINAPQL